MLAAVFAIVLTPSAVMADANPSNHGHHYHYGWANHHSPPPAPTPNPGGGGTTTTGPTNSIIPTVVPADLAQQAPAVAPPVAPVLGPPGMVATTAQPLLAARNLWLVAILLATLVAANVALAVLAVGRGGHLVIKRSLAPVGIRV